MTIVLLQLNLNIDFTFEAMLAYRPIYAREEEAT